MVTVVVVKKGNFDSNKQPGDIKFQMLQTCICHECQEGIMLVAFQQHYGINSNHRHRPWVIFLPQARQNDNCQSKVPVADKDTCYKFMGFNQKYLIIFLLKACVRYIFNQNPFIPFLEVVFLNTFFYLNTKSFINIQCKND